MPSKPGLFHDKAGNWDMTRVMLFLWAFGGFVVWVIISFKTWTVQALPDAIAAVIAALVAGKTVQSFAENA